MGRAISWPCGALWMNNLNYALHIENGECAKSYGTASAANQLHTACNDSNLHTALPVREETCGASLKEAAGHITAMRRQYMDHRIINQPRALSI